MLEENIKKRPLSGKFSTLKSNLKEKPKLVIQNNNNNKINPITELTKNLYDKKLEKILD